MHLPDSNGPTPSPPTVQYTNLHPVIENPQPVVQTEMPPFDISTAAHPSILGDFNAYHPSIFSDDELLAMFPANNAVAPDESLNFNHAYHPSNPPGYYQPGSSNFVPPDFHPTPSTSEPVASSSRQALADVQAGLYHRESGLEYPTRDVKAEPEDDTSIPALPLERRQKKFKNRHQPYDLGQRGTRLGGATPKIIIVPSNFDSSPAIANFLTRQAMKCPIPVKGTPCGQSVKTAQKMSHHLNKAHGVEPNNTSTANVGLNGKCPHCRKKLKSCIYRHLMSHFYRYACPVEGCGNIYSRPDQLRGHCGSHGFQIPDGANEDFAVRKGL